MTDAREPADGVPEPVDPGSTRTRNRLALLVGGGVLVAAAAIGFVLVVTTGSADDTVEGNPSSSASSPASSPAPERSTPAPESSSAAPTPTEPAAVAPPTVVPAPVPVPPADARPPVVVPPDAAATTGAVQVSLTGFTSVTTAGEGPGEISGPGVEVAISITSTGAQSVDLSALTVNVYKGAEGVPLATVMSDPDNRPAPASVKAGQTVTASYRFAQAGSADDVYAVVVDVAPEVAPVVYQGVHPS